MSCFKKYLYTALPVIRAVFTMIWLANLAATDSYFSVYVLLAFASFWLLVRRDGNTDTGKGSGSALVLSALFSGAVILANYPIFTTIGDPALIGRSTSILVNLINTALSFAGGICTACPLIDRFLEMPALQTRQGSALRQKWVPWAVFASLAAINLIHLLLVEYPGNVTEDPFTQIGEMISGTYSNFNTFWHTMLFRSVLSLGYGIFGNVNSAVAVFCVFQMLVLCAAVTYSLVTMRDWGVSDRFLAGAYLIFALMPYHMALSITIWKDVLYAAGCLLMLTAMLRLMKGAGRRQDTAVFILGSLLFLASRTTGWIIYLCSFLVIAVFRHRNKRLLALMGAMALAGWAMLGLLGIPGGDPVESLSIPIQQVSRVVAEGHPLTQEEEELLSRIADLEEVPELYTNWLSDPMKVELRSKDPDFFRENMGQYRQLWLRLGLRYPGSYVKAWVDQTKGYWNGGYPLAMYSETVTDNPYGVEKLVSGNPVASLFRLYFGLSRHVIFFEPFHSIGLHVWLLVLCLFRNLRRRREEGLLAVPLAVMIIGLWLGTPVFCSFRYAYPLFLCFPLLLGTTLYGRK